MIVFLSLISELRLASGVGSYQEGSVLCRAASENVPSGLEYLPIWGSKYVYIIVHECLPHTIHGPEYTKKPVVHVVLEELNLHFTCTGK